MRRSIRSRTASSHVYKMVHLTARLCKTNTPSPVFAMISKIDHWRNWRISSQFEMLGVGSISHRLVGICFTIKDTVVCATSRENWSFHLKKGQEWA